MQNRLPAFIPLVLALFVAACGGGGGGGMAVKGPPSTDMPTNPPMVPATDHSDTTADATPIVLNESFSGTITSATDSDYFRLPVEAEGTLTITTTGNANPHIRAYDAAGVEIPGTPGSYIITITPTILAKGQYIFVEFYDGTTGETYSGSAELTPNPSLSLADKLRLYRTGDPALYMTPRQMKESALDTLYSATHVVGPAADFEPFGSRQPHETTNEIRWTEFPDWLDAGYRSSSFRPVMRHNGVNVFTATRRHINPESEDYQDGCAAPVGGGICVPPPPVQVTALEDYAVLGGWMEHSYFEVHSYSICNTANAGCSGSEPDYDLEGGLTIGSDAMTRPTGTNPVGTGSASWIGIMTGLSFGSNPDSAVRYIGDAQIEIDDLSAPTVDVSFTNIHNLASAERQPDITWNGLAVIDGGFGHSRTGGVGRENDATSTGIGATFAGPNHQEVVGTFSHSYIDSGAFGAKRQ